MKKVMSMSRFGILGLIIGIMTLASCGKDEELNVIPDAAGEIELWETEDGNIVLRTSPIENATAYTWYLDGTAVTATEEPVYEFSESGEYTVAGTNSFGTGKPSLPVTVDASRRPDHLTVEIVTSEEGVVTLEAKADRAWGFRWYLGDKLLQRGSNSVFLPLDNGHYKVQAYNAAGNGDTMEIDVTIGVINLLNPLVVPDVRFREYIKTLSSDSDNDFYSNKNAEKVTELNLQSQGITDLTGIRFFTNLISLNLNYSMVKYLDLRKLTKLEVLDLFSTDALVELNIDGLKAIKSLNINSSRISKVDISGLAGSLEYFNAAYSGYENLDLTAFSKLQYINLSTSTKLSQIKVTGLKKLQTLFLSATPITTLDLSGCESLKSLVTSFSSNLTTLRLPDYAPLEELKVSRCGKGLLDNVKFDIFRNTIKFIYADILDIDRDLVFEDFELLEGLQLDGNRFTSLELKNCTALEILRVAENSKLSTVKLENLPSLNTIYCYQTGVGELDFSDCKNLVQAIIFENSKMTAVDFTGCQLLSWLSMEFSKVGPDLDISDTKNLESVTCTNTDIKRIKINESYDCNKVPFSSKIPVGAQYVHEF